MLKKTLKYSAYRVAPQWSFALEQKLIAMRKKRGGVVVTGGEARAQHEPEALIQEAKRLRQAADHVSTVEEMVDLVAASRLIRSNQHRIEIVGLLKLIADVRPEVVCEIGAAGGGTLAMFAQMANPSGRFLSIDLAYTPGQLRAFPLLLKPEQTLTTIAGDSHLEETLEKTRQWLGGQQMDFLFIDGDHSYEGVLRDYEMYSPLVRTGGIIGFHDIVEDYRTRYGVMTSSDVGGVPAFWKELKSRVDKTKELVEHSWQDGLGIGVVVR